MASDKGMMSGSIGEVVVEGVAAGQCTFSVNLEDVRFIDATGEDLEISDLGVAGVSLIVH